MKKQKWLTTSLTYSALMAIGFFLLIGWLSSHLQTVEINYSDFFKKLASGDFSTVTISENYVHGIPKSRSATDVQEYFARRIDPALVEQLDKAGVSYTGTQEQSAITGVFLWLAPTLIVVAVWFWMMRAPAGRSGMGGLMAIGKSKAKVYVENDIKVTFNDVAGVDEAKAELQEVVRFLKDPKRYGRLGAHIPKGILLVGPPGTGKTLMARAVAGEAGVAFFSISGSEFVEMFVGVGAARVRDLFDQAHEHAPAIIFIDELDALGRARGGMPFGGGHDEKDQTLNQLLAELDGFDPSPGLVLLAATNRPEILDPALLRAGRFDRQVLVDRPDKVGREHILRLHLKKLTLAPDVDPEGVAAMTPGFTGADLANLANEAALLATRRDGENVTMTDFTQALERIVAGLEKRNRLLNPKEREVVAYHEIGHALVALSLPDMDKIHKISIVPRGIGSLGYTIQRPSDEHMLATNEQLENRMAVLLGGRAAEMLIFGQASTGAADDLAKATDIARSMVARFGMTDKIGLASYDQEANPFLAGTPLPMERHRDYSEETSRKIDDGIRESLDRAFDIATEILRRRNGTLDALAKLLLKQETLNEQELEEFLLTQPKAA